MKTWRVCFCIICFLIPNSIALARELGYPGIQLDHVVITGTSNVADFKLVYINMQQNLQQPASGPFPSLLVFHIPVDSITASSKLMVNDFKALIHAAQHPLINIEVDQNQIVSIVEGNEMTTIRVKVTLAGISNWYSIPLFAGIVPGGTRYIMGRTTVNLSDFNLEPKSKFFGLIRIGDEVFINFRINFSPTEITQINKF
ncbi:MAG: YceI family protein [Prolixibacteraceae bacterium]|nr:YceI family protein [Prolixibacteraceae bacterium]